MEGPVRKVIYSSMVSLDGFVEGPNRELDWVIVDEELHTYVNDQHARSTPTSSDDGCTRSWCTGTRQIPDPSNPEYALEFTRIWKSMHKIVFSKTLEHVQGNATLTRETSLKKSPD